MLKFADEVNLTFVNNIELFAVKLLCLATDIEKTKTLYNKLDIYLSAVRAEKNDGFPPWDTTSKKYSDSDIYYGFIKRDEKSLEFTNMTFMSIGYGLPALIAYLKKNGCANIKYTIEQRDMKEVYGDDW